jgi:hypothetical protein
LHKIVTVGESTAGNKRQFRVQTLFLNFQFHWNNTSRTNVCNCKINYENVVNKALPVCPLFYNLSGKTRS